jgi:hypothetical protein
MIMVRSPDKYYSILKLICDGKTTTGEISGSLNLNSNGLSPYRPRNTGTRSYILL